MAHQIKSGRAKPLFDLLADTGHDPRPDKFQKAI